MAAPRKLPPDGAGEDIKRLASEGYGQVGIAAHFNVSRDCFKRWIDESEELNDAYEMGKESERQALHAMVVASARANKGANVNAFFLLKTRHGYVETDNRAKVSVDVALNHVLLIRDHGDDATWAAKCAAQQRALTIDADCTSPLQLEAPKPAQVEAVALSEPTDIPVPVCAPTPTPTHVAASWVAPVQQAVPMTAAPSYGPPACNWQSQSTLAPLHAPEPIRTTPVAPVAAPAWRSRA